MKALKPLLLSALFASALPAFTFSAFAHGDSANSKVASAVKKEQKARDIAGHYTASMVGKIIVTAK